MQWALLSVDNVSTGNLEVFSCFLSTAKALVSPSDVVEFTESFVSASFVLLLSGPSLPVMDA